MCRVLAIAEASLLLCVSRKFRPSVETWVRQAIEKKRLGVPWCWLNILLLIVLSGRSLVLNDAFGRQVYACLRTRHYICWPDCRVLLCVIAVMCVVWTLCFDRVWEVCILFIGALPCDRGFCLPP